ncbi:hypothetical protein FOMPIDRAFT_94622, partial [Fomitopsis schrenkii]
KLVSQEKGKGGSMRRADSEQSDSMEVDESDGSGSNEYVPSGYTADGDDGSDVGNRSDGSMIVKMGKSPRGSKKAPKSGGSEKKAGKVKVKEEPAEAVLENLKAAGISKELLNKQPLKSFMQRAQHEFRVYITLENAWPRKRNNIIEKREVPERIITMTASKYEVYQTKTFKKLFGKVWKDDGLHELMIKQVYKGTAQLRQDIKQKAKKVVEKAFLQFQLPKVDANGDELSAEAVEERLWAATEARVKWLRKDSTFHHGNLKLPDPSQDPELWEANLRAPYHNEVVSEVIARQWWMGAHPEALKAEHRDRFDLTKPLSSNLIALVCTSEKLGLLLCFS